MSLQFTAGLYSSATYVKAKLTLVSLFAAVLVLPIASRSTELGLDQKPMNLSALSTANPEQTSETVTADALYNLGVDALGRTDRPGTSSNNALYALAYSRFYQAALIEAQFAEAYRAMNYVLDKAAPKGSIDTPSRLESLSLWVRKSLPLPAIATVGALSLLALTWISAQYRYRRTVALRAGEPVEPKSRWTLWLGFIFATHCAALLFWWTPYLSHSAIVVASQRASLSVAPNNDSSPIGTVVAGDRVSVERSEADWVLIKTETGRRGWIAAGDVESLSVAPKQLPKSTQAEGQK